MEVVSAIITPIVESLLVPIKRHLCFFFHSREYDRDMHAKIKKLSSAAIDMTNRKDENHVKNLMIPHRVESWLEEAQVIIDREADNNSAGGNGCLHMKRRYKTGKHCSTVIKDVDGLMEEKEKIAFDWTNEQIPLGMVSSATPQVLENDVTQNIFGSRKEIFQSALQLLGPDDTTQLMALCGMGGIGKTTMMEELKAVVENRKMFDRVVRVVIGNSTDPIAFQGAIAQYTGENLSETTREARADRLKQRFLGMSQNGKKKILIILDDLWNIVDLKDIGLSSPLPKGFKLFLTSRDRTLCSQMRVEPRSILKMVGLEEPEAKQLFWNTIGTSDGFGDRELHKLGEDIVKRCGGLPMAIKTIARALTGKTKGEWKLTLSRLERHNLQDLYAVAQHIFEISYDYLKKDDDQKIFILSGLFPDDFDIPLEDLMSYGWGLKLFDNVSSLFEARLQTNASIHNLIRANLLVESDRIGCVKMHDLARSFILSNISKFKQASVVNHSDMSGWPTQDTRDSCERILSIGIPELSRHFDYPDLKLLTLMINTGRMFMKVPLTFPEDFYTRMKKLQVISYRNILYPSLPISPQCVSSLRVLSLHSCSLMDDLSSIGHLINLEILSFAYTGIEYLPSTIGNLKNLKLLDLTECDNIYIGDGVLQNLDKLEELYMRTYSLSDRVISFTENNCEGLEMVSKKLTALEVEFYNNIIRPNHMSFKKLERFRISIGCKLSLIFESDAYSYENTLKLVASCEEVHASEINELFEKTENLDLQVKDINHLEDVLMHPSQYSFCNLKYLSFRKCENLKYLFTVNVASTLTNLERLIVESCGVLESLIHDENNGAEVIKFHKLKHIILEDLPEFVGLCDNINIVMEFPQLMWLRLEYLPNITCIFASSSNISETTIPLLNKEVVCPKLVELVFCGLKKLKEIWACEIASSKEEDDSTPMLKKIEVKECDDIQNLFPKNPMRLLSHLEELTIQKCGSIQALFDIDSGCVGHLKSSLRRIWASQLGKLREVWRISDEGNSGLLIVDFQALESIEIYHCENFRNIVTPTTIKFEKGALTTIIDSSGDEWGRNNRSVEFIQDQESFDSWSVCQYSKVIKIKSCYALSTVIPSYAAKQPQKIEVLEIHECSSMIEVFETKVFKYSPNFGQGNGGRDDTTPAAISQLKNITTHLMPYLKTLDIQKCPRLVDIFTFSTLGSLGLLEKLSIKDCEQLKVIVRKEHGAQATTTSKVVTCPSLKSIILSDLPELEGFFLGMNEFQLPVLDEVIIKSCHQMMVFTSLPLRAPKLEYIHINAGKYRTPECCSLFTAATLPQTPSQSSENANSWTTISEEFLLYSPSLIEMNLEFVQKCQVIFSYDELLQLQNLEKLHAIWCRSVLEVFDIGTGVGTVVTLPKLNDVHLWSLTSLKYIWNCDGRTTLEFPNLTKLSILGCDRLEHVFTCSMARSLLQLKELRISWCEDMEVIVKEDREEVEGGDIGKVNELIRLPCLKSLELEKLHSLKGFCLGNVDYSFPSLERVKIKECRSLVIFTKGGLFVPELKVIETSLGDIKLADDEQQDINSFIIAERQKGFRF